MTEGNVFFLRIRDLARKGMHTCTADSAVVEAASLMRDRNVSGLVICEGERPVGVLTDRDLRNKVVCAGADPQETRVSSVMTSPLVTVAEDDYVFEAIYKMTKHRIHRVVVVDAEGRLAGVVTDSDVIGLQANTPGYLMRDLDSVTGAEELRHVSEKVTGLVAQLLQTGVRTRDLVKLISNIHDAVVLKAIEILRAEHRWDLPEGFAFLVLGSEGRMEQTLLTDQDNAIVYADELGPEAVAALREFSSALIDSLISIGVPECPGGMMANNEPWRRSLSNWVDQIAQWGARPTPDNLLRYGMFADLRTLYGDPGLEKTLKEHITRHIRQNTVFLARLAKNVVRFTPPLGLFGTLKTEKLGPHRGKIDVKKAGIFQISEGVKVLALDAGYLQGGTREKLEHLEREGVVSEDDASELEASYNFLVYVRLRSQIEQITAGKPPTNFIDPGALSHVELMRLKIGLRAVRSFQNLLTMRYRLNFIAD